MKSSKLLIVICIIVVTLATVFLLFRISTSPEMIEDEGLLFEIGAGRGVYHLVEVPSCQTGESPREIARRAPRKFVVKSESIDFSKYKYQLVKVWGSLKKERRKLEPPEIVCFKSPCFTYQDELVIDVRELELSDKKLSSCQEDYLKWSG